MACFDFAWHLWNLFNHDSRPVYLPDGRIIGYYLDGRWQVRLWHADRMEFLREPLQFETDAAVQMAAWLNQVGATPERPPTKSAVNQLASLTAHQLYEKQCKYDQLHARRMVGILSRLDYLDLADRLTLQSHQQALANPSYGYRSVSLDDVEYLKTLDEFERAGG